VFEGVNKQRRTVVALVVVVGVVVVAVVVDVGVVKVEVVRWWWMGALGRVWRWSPSGPLATAAAAIVEKSLCTSD
jgi:hypothetical protein